MKTRLLIIPLLLIALSSFGQIEFEKGYFINNDNQKKDCLIKNFDWKNNPEKITYRLSADSDPKDVGISEIKEFGIDGYGKFVRANVQIDRSGEKASDLGYTMSPEWIPAQLFLKVLVEGKATLFYYEEENLIRFFYSVADSFPSQLVYKKYLTEDGNITANFGFRQQLWNFVKHPDMTASSVENVDYEKNELVKYFKKYNESDGGTSTVYEKNVKNSTFNLKVTPGITASGLSVSCENTLQYNVDFDMDMNFITGVEAEFLMPFNNNKWSFIIEPTFLTMKAKSRETINGWAAIDYKSVVCQLGVRYYFFLGNDLKLFTNAFYIPSYSLNFNSNIDYTNTTPMDIQPGQSFAAGGGVEYKKISAEIRYYTKRQLLKGYNSNWDTDFTMISFTLGYKILK